MERLTKKELGCFEYALKDHKPVPGEFGTYEAFFDYSLAIKKLGYYENIDPDPEKIAALGPVDHLRDLIQAEQTGRLVVLPCKTGDMVYFALLGRIIEKAVFSIVSFANSQRIYCAGTSEYFRPEDIGKTVFLTRDEAEAALEAQEGGGEK